MDNVNYTNSSSFGSKNSVYCCGICEINYLNASGLWKYNQKFHKDIFDSKVRNPSFKCGLCDELLLTQIKICEHVKRIHSIEINIHESRLNRSSKNYSPSSKFDRI